MRLKIAPAEELAEGFMEHCAPDLSKKTDECRKLSTDGVESRALMSPSFTTSLSSKASDMASPEHLNIGVISENVAATNEIYGAKLSFHEHIALDNVRQVIGHRQVSSCELEFLPQWLLDEFVNEELCKNRKDE